MLKELIADDTFVPAVFTGWRASEIGRDCETYLCHRKLQHEGVSASGRIRHMLDDGRAHERDIVERLEANGFLVKYALEDQIAVQYGGVSGHPDGLLKPPSRIQQLDFVDEHFRRDCGWYLLEITAPNSASFRRIVRDHLKVALHQKYVQLQIYLASERVKSVTNYCIVEVKCKNTSELYEEGISSDSETVAWALERAKRVDELVSRGKVSDFRCDDWRQHYCAFRNLCFVEDEVSVGDFHGILKGETLKEAEELVGLAELWKKGKILEVDGKDMVEEVRERFLEVLEDYGAQGLVVAGVSAKMIESQRRTCDIEALKAFPDAFVRCVSTNKSRYVRVTD